MQVTNIHGCKDGRRINIPGCKDGRKPNIHGCKDGNEIKNKSEEDILVLVFIMFQFG